HKLRVSQCEIDCKFAAMRAADDKGVLDFEVLHQRQQIICLVIQRSRSGRTSVAAAIVAHCVELFTEGRPDAVPNGRVSYAIVDEDYRVRSRAALFVVDFAAFNIYKL